MKKLVGLTLISVFLLALAGCAALQQGDHDLFGCATCGYQFDTEAHGH